MKTNTASGEACLVAWRRFSVPRVDCKFVQRPHAGEIVAGLSSALNDQIERALLVEHSIETRAIAKIHVEVGYIHLAASSSNAEGSSLRLFPGRRNRRAYSCRFL